MSEIGITAGTTFVKTLMNLIFSLSNRISLAKCLIFFQWERKLSNILPSSYFPHFNDQIDSSLYIMVVKHTDSQPHGPSLSASMEENEQQQKYCDTEIQCLSEDVYGGCLIFPFPSEVLVR